MRCLAGCEFSRESNPYVTFHRADGTLRARFFGLQGGGLYISGTATLTNTNVYSNQANLGGGLYIEGTATLTNTNVYSNQADSYGNGSGGGVYVLSNGVANFESCNIHDNTAEYVCLHL